MKFIAHFELLTHPRDVLEIGSPLPRQCL